MTADEQQNDLERIAEKILALAEARKGERQPYLVSALGIDLGEDLRTLKLITGKGLNDFIQNRLTGQLTLVRLGDHRNVAAIIDGATNLASVAACKPSEEKRRFHYRFWAAFSVPAKHEVRVLNLDNLTFGDVALAEVPNGAPTIPNELIAPEDADNRDELIKTNIATWLRSRDLPEERFFASRGARGLLVARLVPASGSLLEAMIAALDRKQLQSTTLSLDVVATLLRTPQS